MEELLERQWEQGSQFLMEQGQHFDSKCLGFLNFPKNIPGPMYSNSDHLRPKYGASCSVVELHEILEQLNLWDLLSLCCTLLLHKDT